MSNHLLLGRNQKSRVSHRGSTRSSPQHELDGILKSYVNGLSQLGQKLKKKSRVMDTTRTDSRLKSFKELTDGVLAKVDALDRTVTNRVEKKKLRQAFRKTLAPWLQRNGFIMRCLKKPRGYPGDYMMMELGYNDKVSFTEDLGGFFDRYFIDKYHCIVLRKEKVKNYIRSLLLNQNVREEGATKYLPDEPVDVLSLGGGPAREWMELGKEKGLGKAQGKVRLVYLDQDKEATLFARNRLSQNHLLRSVEFIEGSLYNFSGSNGYSALEGRFHLIYGIGIADYFHDQVLTNIVVGSLTKLRRNGMLLLTHKDQYSFPFSPADWLCDWTFVQRGEIEFVKILRKAAAQANAKVKIEIQHESSGQVLFGILTKA